MATPFLPARRKAHGGAALPAALISCEAEVSATATLPTRFGDFRIVAFRIPGEDKEHTALLRGDIKNGENVVVRIHSECLTGDAFGSLRCDCREQLEASMKEVAALDRGVILYLRQEGRGIGLANKIKAYALQETGLDTVEANEALGFRADERNYEVAARMLDALGVRSIRLMSNNPEKLRNLEFHGVRVVGRIPLVTAPNEHNARYLDTKRVHSGHLLGTRGVTA